MPSTDPKQYEWYATPRAAVRWLVAQYDGCGMSDKP